MNLGRNNQILCLRNIDIETLGNYEKLLTEDGYRIIDIMASDLVTLSVQVDRYDAIFVLGGPMSANDDYDYLHYEKQLISRAVENHIPLMGICLGSQLIAASCGGKVYKGVKKEIGWGDVSLTKIGSERIFKNNFTNSLQVFHWHGDTFLPPVGAEILSRNELYIQAFKYRSAIGIQFHIEVNQRMIMDWSNRYKKEIELEGISVDNFFRKKEQDFARLTDTSKVFYEYFKSFFN
ncbi:type 1 glutamine amidotransferase [Candidatus Nitrosocosmicus sp. SS]|jgi:GMP synthase-like glutamine amidotransferase|nr:type 1 glutamine amidotransferase [Candidatus Nitrosocosmicus sp. SS]KAF0869842.1 type 1 glutamine amidotransferase [Candidatus Nitrosocosmicus sp. SS]